MTTTFTANYGLDKPAVSDTGWGPSRNQNMDDLDAELFKPRIGQSALAWGASVTIDLSLARVFTGTVNANAVLAFSNVPASFPNGANVPVVFCDLLLTNGGAFTITWPGSIVWLQGAAPQLQSAGVDRIRLVTRDGGTTWYAVHMGKNLPSTTKLGIGGSASQARPVLLLACLNGLTTNTVEGSIASYTLPASALAATTDAIRIRLYGNALNQNGQLRVKFGAGYVLNVAGTNNITQPNAYMAEVIIRRTGAATQAAVAQVTQGAVVTTTERTTPAETLSGSVLIDVRGNTFAGGGSLNVDAVTIEYLGS